MSWILVDENNVNICEGNIALFLELKSKGFVVESCSIYNSNINEAWSIDFVDEKKYCINVNTKEPNFPQFTHELLHIWLDDCGYKNKKELKELLREDFKTLSNKIFEFNLFFDQCGIDSFLNDWRFVAFENSISHFKMINKFIELGFERKFFLFSYENDYDCLQRELGEIDIHEEGDNTYNYLPNYRCILLYLRIRSLEYIHEEFSPVQIDMLIDRLKRNKNIKTSKLIDFCDAFFFKWIRGDIGCDNHQLYRFMLDNYNRYIIKKQEENNIEHEIELTRFSDDSELNINSDSI